MENCVVTETEEQKFKELSKKVNGSLGELFHQHLIIKAFVENPPIKEEFLNYWLKDLVEKIGMKIVIGPFSKYVESVGNAGLTGAVVIETSHSSIHVWSECVPAMIQMDVYSCAPYSDSVIIDKLKEFGLISYEKISIDRNEEFKITGPVYFSM